LFVYGLLKPDEPAYALIAEYVSERSTGTIGGCLWLRDGLPLFDPDGAGEVSGVALRFDPTRTDEAWRAVGEFEPDKQYKYATVDVALAGEPVRANVLIGLQLSRGTAPESVDRWSASMDPVFVEGLAEVLTMTIGTAPDGVASQPDGDAFWRMFFRLQAAYLLLWSIVERYTVLRYGPGLGPVDRVRRLGADQIFKAAVVEVDAVGNVVYDARDPGDKVTIRADGSRASDYFYQVRSNLSHRGKSAFQDGRLVFKALVQLHDVIRTVLAQQVPALTEEWKRYEPDGWLLRPRVPSKALAAGRTAPKR
jgi:gamma-glutamylcyclotransferase (GGCT)/AIG2-like uncharacterized protein YtfP